MLDTFALQMRENRVSRLKKIDRLLRRGEMISITEAARRFSVSRRTIERDFEIIEKNGGAIEKLPCGRYQYRDPSFTLKSVSVTEGELYFFLLGEQALKQYRGTPFQTSIEAAYDKIKNYVLDKELDLDTMIVHFNPGPITINYDPQIFKCIVDAVSALKKVKISYFTASTRTNSEREIAPYNIVNLEGDWYVIGHCFSKNEVRKFHIGRIKSAQILQTEFRIPDSFDADEYLSRGFGVVSDGMKHTVKLRFSPVAAVYVTEKEWHKNQIITSTEDGGAVLQFTTEGLDAVKRWVLSFGGEVRVIGPQELREDVRKEAERILAER